MRQLANYNHSTILRLYGERGGTALDILLIFCMLLLCKCNCNCNLAHESLAFPFVFCNYALSWIVVDVVAVLLLALQASSFAFNYCSHFSNFSPSVLRCRLCNTALSLSSVSAICYLHLTDSCMYVFATESASCSANIMLIMHFTLRARMHLLPCPSFHFPFSLGIALGKFSEELAKPPVKSFAY